MLLSRFWYVVLGLVLGALVFTLYIAQSMYNRAGSKVLAESLSSDSQVVSWYLRSQSRERSGQLIKFALSPEVSQALQKSSRSEQVPKDARESADSALAKLVATTQEGRSGRSPTPCLIHHSSVTKPYPLRLAPLTARAMRH